MAQHMLEIVAQEENKVEPAAGSTLTIGEMKSKDDDIEIVYANDQNTPLSTTSHHKIEEDDLETKPFDKESDCCLFYFGGRNSKHEQVFYAIHKRVEKQYQEESDPMIYECHCVNVQRPLSWPQVIYLTEKQLKSVQFIKRGSESEKTVFHHYSLYGLKKGFLFYFELLNTEKTEEKQDKERLIYIIDDVIEMQKGDDVYQCTNVFCNEESDFPDRIYLTKHQLNEVTQLLGLDIIKKRAIYNDQQSELNKLQRLDLYNADLDAEESQLKLLREEKLNWYFCIYYHGKTEQIVYYISDIENVDKFVCKLSKKNALDKLEADISYPSMIICNRKEINELEENGHAFDGTGCRLYFDKDIYSLYGSFYFSTQQKQTRPLLIITVGTFIIQMVSIYAIGWCFDVAYTEDVVKHYTIKEFHQCGFEADYMEINDTDSAEFCLNVDPNFISTSNYTYYTNYNDSANYTFVYKDSLAMIEGEGYTQEFVISHSAFYKLGYVCTAFTSLLILTFYVYKNAVGPIKLIASLKYCDTIDQKAQKKVRRLAYFNALTLLCAYGLALWSIITFPMGQGIANPFDVLALPISVVFVLELDNWVYHIVQIGYTEYIQSSFNIEITKTALADFGIRSWELVRLFIYMQALVCLISLAVATFKFYDASNDVFEVFFSIIAAVNVFTWFMITAFIWSATQGQTFMRKLVYTIIIAGYLLLLTITMSSQDSY